MSIGIFNDRKFPPVGFGPELGDDSNDIAPPESSQKTKLHHYTHVGAQLIAWAQNRKKWPKTIKELLQALKAHHGDYNPIADEADRCLVISNKYERFSLIQAGDGVGDFSGQPTKPVLHPDNDVEFFSEPHSHQVELGGEGGKQGLEFIIRLPPCGQVTESEDRVKNGQSGYGLPPLYTDILFSSRPNRVSELEILRARVADYTMRSCR